MAMGEIYFVEGNESSIREKWVDFHQ